MIVIVWGDNLVVLLNTLHHNNKLSKRNYGPWNVGGSAPSVNSSNSMDSIPYCPTYWSNIGLIARFILLHIACVRWSKRALLWLIMLPFKISTAEHTINLYQICHMKVERTLSRKGHMSKINLFIQSICKTLKCLNYPFS